MIDLDLEAEKTSLLDLHARTRINDSTDVEEEMRYITDETFLIPPRERPIVGLQGVRRVIEETKNSMTKPIGEPSKGVPHLWMSDSGDMAIIRGSYRVVNECADGSAEERGYYVTIYRKFDGQWKILGEMWNTLDKSS